MKNKEITYTMFDAVEGYKIPEWFKPKDIMLANEKFCNIVLPGKADSNKYCYIRHYYQIGFNHDYFSWQKEVRFSPTIAKQNLDCIKKFLSEGHHSDRTFKFVTVKEVFTRIEGISAEDLHWYLQFGNEDPMLKRDMGYYYEGLIVSESQVHITFNPSKHDKIIEKIKKYEK